MKFDIFTEVQKRDCEANGGFGQLLRETVEQARAAEAAGYETWWQVEHHCSGDFSYSCCPELILSEIARATTKLRLGHSGILVPLEINHWLRSAERSAMLDHISGGRMEIGLARSSGKEWETFGVPSEEQALKDLFEATRLLPRAWTDSAFTWTSDRWSVGERDVRPKPVQSPHPPLWHTGSSPSSFQRAGDMGVGMLCTTLFTPVSALQPMVELYKQAVAACTQPAGRFINNQVGVFTFVHVAENEKAAIASNALRSALWYVSCVPKTYNVSRDTFFQMLRGNIDPRSTQFSWKAVKEDALTADDVDDENPAVALVKRELAGLRVTNEDIWEVLRDVDSIIIGDPETCRKKVARIRDAGFDRLLCMHQYGELTHADILSSIQRFANLVAPVVRETARLEATDA